MSWEKIDAWHMKNGLWTMTWADNVKLPFGLYKGDKNYGYFATSKEAKEEHLRVLKNEVI